MTWILIIYLHMSATGMTMYSTEFNSEQNCISAMEKAEAKFKKFGTNYDAVCVEK